MQPEFDLLVADARVLNPDRAGEGLQRSDIMIDGGRSLFGLPLDFAVDAIVLVALIGLGARLYPKIIT